VLNKPFVKLPFLLYSQHKVPELNLKMPMGNSFHQGSQNVGTVSLYRETVKEL